MSTTVNLSKSPSLSADAPGFLGRNWKVVAGVVIVVVAVLAYSVSRRGPAQASTAGAVSTAKVERRDLVRSLRIHGTTAAVESYPITVPRMSGQPGGQLVITKLVPAGARVRPGDMLVEFDRQNQIRNALDRRAEFLDLEEQIKKKIAEQSAAKARDDTELEQAKNTAEKARLEMRRNEVVSRIDAEKNKQTLDEGEARLKQLEATYQLKRAAERADLRILEIRRDRAGNSMRWAEGNAQKMSIQSPIEGLVVINFIWKGNSMGEVLEGDEVRPGAPIMQVVNPNSMEVRVRVNQADVPFLKVGQPAEFRLDAFPNQVFKGKLERVSAMGAASGMNPYVRTFNAIFSIVGADANLLPDLAAAVDAELERIPNALLVPRDAIETEDGKTYIRVQRGSGWERRAVKVVGENNIDAALESGVEPGDVVLRRSAPPAAAGGTA